MEEAGKIPRIRDHKKESITGLKLRRLEIPLYSGKVEKVANEGLAANPLKGLKAGVFGFMKKLVDGRGPHSEGVVDADILEPG